MDTFPDLSHFIHIPSESLDSRDANLVKICLPDEITIRVMKFLDIKDLFHFGSCARQFFNLFRSNDIWKKKIVTDFPWIEGSKEYATSSNFFHLYPCVDKVFSKIKSTISKDEPDVNQLLPYTRQFTMDNVVRFVIDKIPYLVAIEIHNGIRLVTLDNVSVENCYSGTAVISRGPRRMMTLDGWKNTFRKEQYRKWNGIFAFTKEEIDLCSDIGLISVSGVYDYDELLDDMPDENGR